MLAELLNSPQGQGLLAAAFGAAASARRGAPWNTLGAGGLAGLSAMSNAQDRVTQQQQDQLRQQYMKAQTGHLEAQTQDQQRKAKAVEEQRAWLQSQNPAALATGGNMAPTNDNAQRLAQVDPRQQQMWDLAARGLLPFDEYLKMTAPQKPQQKVVGNTLLEVSDKGVKPLYTAPEQQKTPEALRTLAAIYGEGSPEYTSAARRLGTKMTTHQPGVSVSYGSPVAGVDAGGNPVFFQPSKDGTTPPAIVQGVKPAPQNRDTKLPAELQRMQIAGDTMSSLLDDYEGLLDKHNPRNPLTQMNPTARADIQAVKRNLELQFKELQALGALAGPDIEIMRQALADPFSFDGAFYGTGGLKAQVKRARELVQKRRDAVNASQGKPADQQPQTLDPLGIR